MPEAHSRTHRDALRLVPQFLSDYLNRPPTHIKVAEPRNAAADLLVKVKPRGPTFVCEVKGSSRAATVRQAARVASSATGRTDAIPLVVVPYMGRAGAEAASEEGVGYLDLSGNANFRWPGGLVRVEGKPNAFPERGRPASAFAPRSARISRILLIEHKRWWTQAELARETGLGTGQVSKVVRRLSKDGLLERQDRSVRAQSPRELLDAWAAEYSYDRHSIVAGHVTGSGFALARELGARLATQTGRLAFTGLPAAWAMDRFARFRLVSVYVDADPVETAESIGMRMEPRGANVHLVAPNDDGVFAGMKRFGGIPCVSPVQTYLDLLSMPERASEAAEHLRRERLGFWRTR